MPPGGWKVHERVSVRVPKILVAIGASSYSLYLIHPFVLAAFGKAWSALHLSAVPAFIPGAIGFAAALLAAHATYLWLEKPMTALLKRPISPVEASPRHPL
jgi:exopolysaccharide production protein ExoZ